MPLQPMVMNGKMRLVSMPSDAGAHAMWQVEEENARRSAIRARREAYEASMYDLENLETMAALGLDPLTARLPEHERLHPYSGQIQECVDFIADQLAEKFELVFADPAAEATVMGALTLSDQFTGINADDDVAVENVIREALLAGDVAVELKRDPVDGVYLECWDSEQVRFDYATRRRLSAVTREEVVWVPDPATREEMQVLERRVYTLKPSPSAPDGALEAVCEVFWDQEDAPREVEWLGLPFLPWVLLKGTQRSLRATRGESVVTDQAMEHASRLNAVGQVAWLIARYNSHGNLAVVGDAAHLKIEEEGHVGKDVADVLTFPGGTSVMGITLPTDPEMIEQQRTVLTDAIYNAFGLTRVDVTTMAGLSQVSGYALEILNRQTEGTFRRVRRTFAESIRNLVALVLDADAYWQAPIVAPEGELPSGAFWTVDPGVVYPNRTVEVRMGSGYIVDEAMTRTDFQAQFVSRAEALRQRGMSDDDIARIQDEIDSEQPPPPEVGLFSGAGSTVGQATKENP